jgi:hypothetical protein
MIDPSGSFFQLLINYVTNGKIGTIEFAGLIFFCFIVFLLDQIMENLTGTESRGDDD